MAEFQAQVPEIREHYAYVTRSLIRLFVEGELPNVTSIDVEPDYGYTTRITYTDGSHRITYGNDLGLNPGASEDLAKDKGHTKFLLRTIGVQCPDGEEFLLPWWAETIGESQEKRGNDSMRTTSDAREYVESTFGFPVYIKPVAGSKGLGVRRVDNDEELQAAIDELETARSRVAVIEEVINMPDYRIVTLDGKLISAYQRVPLRVVGDGRQSIRNLLATLQEKFDADGRDTILTPDDPRFARQLSKIGLDLDSVPASGSDIRLADISNLSAGGTSVDVAQELHPRWVDLTAYVGENFNLRLLGLDLACMDITGPNSDYSTLEVNSTPGLDHYASSGDEQQRIVDGLYASVFNAFPLR